jgi:hypothetical protein
MQKSALVWPRQLYSNKGDGSRKKEEEIVILFLPLLSNRSITQLQSAYMLWQDTERTLKMIESDSIIGVGTERTHECIYCLLAMVARYLGGRGEVDRAAQGSR